jgi:hypothetical protein
VDAAAVGWEAWRKADQENSMGVLQAHIVELKTQGYLVDDVDTNLMTYCISGALNELALQYSSAEDNQALYNTISSMVDGFKKK